MGLLSRNVELRPIEVRTKCWRPSRDVLWCRSASAVAILSLRTGRYHTLDGTGASVWQMLVEEHDFTRIVETVGDTGDRERAESDITELFQALNQAGLIHAKTQGPKPVLTESSLGSVAVREDQSASAVPSVVACLAGLIAFYFLLRICPLRTVLGLAFSEPARTIPDSTWGRRLARRIETATMICPFSAECLERSLAYLWFARRGGIHADLRFGVVLLPFEAHAWVEHRGCPLNELEESIVRFAKFPPVNAGYTEARG